MKKILILYLTTLLMSCSTDEYEQIIPLPDISNRVLAGGETTYFSSSSFAYSFPAPNMSSADKQKHSQGDGVFDASFVIGSPLNTINFGLGPIFNNNACVECHPNDGRAAFPENLNDKSGFFLRASIPGIGMNNAPVPVPGVGTQIQNHAIQKFKPEATFKVTYTEIEEVFADGTKVILRKPHYWLENTYIPVPADILLSPRIGSPVFGLGLLEAIPEANILAQQDIDDRDGDGISGKANYVYDAVSKSVKLGRFGWKANTATLLEQCAGAFVHDMGVTNPLFPTETGKGQSNGNDQLDDDPEIDQETLDLVTFYCQTLAVPAARNLEKESVRNGARLFETIGCAKCHTPEQKTGVHSVSALSNQTFYPYTDMLLHDMGDDLADGRPDFLANGNEWKTRPLWGIGLQFLVNGHTEFLHDGRAKNVTEAILWHGGEAKNSKEEFKKLSKKEREDLLEFLNSI